jgi:hypothetical protein
MAKQTPKSITPQELRENARQKLASAETTFNNGDADNAANLAGLAVESMLKARFCTRHKWLDFPAEVKELRKRAKANKLSDVVTHDLDTLLTLSDDTRLKQSSFHNIDWARVTDWDVEQRYYPPGTCARSEVAAQITESKKLVGELTLYEILEALVATERELSESMGQFNLFAFVEHEKGQGKWAAWISAWWIDTHESECKVVTRIKSSLDTDCSAMLARVIFLYPDDERVWAFHSMGEGRHLRQFMAKGVAVSDSRFVSGHISLPSGFVITSDSVPKPEGVGSTGFFAPEIP